MIRLQIVGHSKQNGNRKSRSFHPQTDSTRHLLLCVTGDRDSSFSCGGARGWERRAGEKEIAGSRHASGVRQYCIICAWYSEALKLECFSNSVLVGKDP